MFLLMRLRGGWYIAAPACRRAPNLGFGERFPKVTVLALTRCRGLYETRMFWFCQELADGHAFKPAEGVIRGFAAGAASL